MHSFNSRKMCICFYLVYFYTFTPKKIHVESIHSAEYFLFIVFQTNQKKKSRSWRDYETRCRWPVRVGRPTACYLLYIIEFWFELVSPALLLLSLFIGICIVAPTRVEALIYDANFGTAHVSTFIYIHIIIYHMIRNRSNLHLSFS